jgi:hypothetical protein
MPDHGIPNYYIVQCLEIIILASKNVLIPTQQGQLWLALKHGQVLVSDMRCVHNIDFSNHTPVAPNDRHGRWALICSEKKASADGPVGQDFALVDIVVPRSFDERKEKGVEQQLILQWSRIRKLLGR